MSLTRLYLIRHGQTLWNVEGRMQGRLDSALTTKGCDQAHAHGRLLKSLGRINRMIVSPAGRTRATAYIINSYARAKIDYDDALQERDIGDWSGMTVLEIEQNFPQAWRARMSDPYHFRPPQGENLADMGSRCESFLDDLLTQGNDCIALITHQVMSRVIAGRLLALGPKEVVRIVHPNELFYRFDFDSDTIQASHYLDGEGPRPGLLHQTYSETIARLKRESSD